MKNLKETSRRITERDQRKLITEIYENSSCGNAECAKFCIQAHRTAEKLTLNVRDFIRDTVEEQVVPVLGCEKYDASAHKRQRPCRFGFVPAKLITLADSQSQWKYTFVSAPGSCEKCRELNGTTVNEKQYDNDRHMKSLGFWKHDDGIYRPHPHCKCKWKKEKISVSYVKSSHSFAKEWTNADFVAYYYRLSGPGYLDTDKMGLTGKIFSAIEKMILPRLKSQINDIVADLVKKQPFPYGHNKSYVYSTERAYDFSSVRFSLGDGVVRTRSKINYGWVQNGSIRTFHWTAAISFHYSDIFKDPLDIGLEIGNAYCYGHLWTNCIYIGDGFVFASPKL